MVSVRIFYDKITKLNSNWLTSQWEFMGTGNWKVHRKCKHQALFIPGRSSSSFCGSPGSTYAICYLSPRLASFTVAGCLPAPTRPKRLLLQIQKKENVTSHNERESLVLGTLELAIVPRCVPGTVACRSRETEYRACHTTGKDKMNVTKRTITSTLLMQSTLRGWQRIPKVF